MNKECDKIRQRIFMLECGDEIPSDIKEHIAVCSECKKEYGKLMSMYGMMPEATPVTPDFKDSVMEKIAGEKIADAPRRFHIPIGTLAAVAAVIAVYVSVYGTNLTDVFIGKDSAAEQNNYAADEDIDPQSELFGIAEDGTAFRTAICADYNGEVGAAQDVKLYSKAESFSDTTAIDPPSDADMPQGVRTEVVDDCEVVESEAEESTDALLDSVKVQNATTASFSGAKELSEYSDRITDEQIEEVGREIYELFIAAITDFENEYTYENLLEFAKTHK